MLKNVAVLSLLAVFVFSIAACNLVEGAAKGGKKDLEETGEVIENATD